MTKLDRPREIIEFCLQPLGLATATDEYKEAYRRLEHVIKTFQLMAIREKMPTEVDFSNMRTITINEAAHGDDS
jgi:S-methylmethionine-dependent homocysteine/selenocysteine methylase